MLMGFSTRKLAYVVDSLVRVSRRVSRSHFDKISTKDPQAIGLTFLKNFQ